MMKLPLKTGHKSALIATLMASCFSPLTAAAQDVTLKSADGSIDLVGELVEYSDEFYVLQTALGNLRISASRVRCEGAACPVIETANADVVIKGSEAVGVGLMPLLVEGFAAFKDAEAQIESTNVQGEILANFIGDQGFGDELGSYLVTATNTGDGLQSLLANEAQIAMASRRILPQEARDLRDAGAGNMVSPDQEHIIAVDSIVVITHPDNPVTSLTLSQVADMYSGRITNWSQVGGEDLAVQVVTREDGADIRGVFDNRVRGEEAEPVTPAAYVSNSHNQSAGFVTENPGAIGYVGFSFLRGAKPIPLINECNIPMIPDAFSAKTEEYALQRRIYLYNRADTTDAGSQEFINYARSEAADSVILKSGFIDLGIQRQVQEADSERAASILASGADQFETQVAEQMVAEMIEYERLSTTFRFRTGSARLDERGQLDLARLANYLRNEPAGSEVVVVGFTDDVGPFSANQQLSVSRAEQIVEEMRAAVPDLAETLSIRATGYGEIAPAACNVSDTGRAINRRVEVWIKSAT